MAWRYLVLSLVVGIIALTACGPAAQAPAAGPATQAAPATQGAAPKAAAAQAQSSAPAVQKPAEKPAAQLRMMAGSSDISSSFYAYCVAEAKFLNAAVPELAITVAASGGSDDNLRRMVRKEFQMTHNIATGLGYQAYHGLNAWKDKAVPDLRLLWINAVNARVVVVTEASGVKSLEDLRGKRMNPGLRGSSTEKDFESQMDILGIKAEYYRGGTDDAITAIKDKAIIGYVKTQAGTTLDGSTMDVMAFTKVRLLGYTDEHIKKIAEKRPWDVWMNLKEDELYKGAPALKAIAVVVGTGTLKGNIPDDVAYKMVKAINEKGADEIAASIKYMKGWQFAQRTAELGNLPLHPGAVKYLQEQGLKLRPELIPPEMK